MDRHYTWHTHGWLTKHSSEVTASAVRILSQVAAVWLGAAVY